jgi:hypothetical protein
VFSEIDLRFRRSLVRTAQSAQLSRADPSFNQAIACPAAAVRVGTLSLLKIRSM